MKKIVVLGSTGSIGTQTLDVVDHLKKELTVCALAAGGGRPELLAEQIIQYTPALVAVYDEAALAKVKEIVQEKSRQSGKKLPAIQWRSGMEGLIEAVTLPEAQLVVTALVGMIGIRPTVAAIQAGKDIALANKETLVCAGSYIMNLARQSGVRILPVDSEHGAIFQCLQGVKREDVHKIMITASGGPFRGYSRKQLEQVTLAQALKHPSWSMGAKITIDSATLMNKGLEMIEAMHLFQMKPEQIEPIIHPQSIVHSMVEMKDSSVLAQLGVPDMRLPIEVALTYPERGPRVAAPLDFRTQPVLSFEQIDETVFPSTALARYAMQRGGLFPAVYNAANEIAVSDFRQGRRSFVGIFEAVEKALSAYERQHTGSAAYTLEEVIGVYDLAERLIED